DHALRRSHPDIFRPAHGCMGPRRPADPAGRKMHLRLHLALLAGLIPLHGIELGKRPHRRGPPPLSGLRPIGRQRLPQEFRPDVVREFTRRAHVDPLRFLAVSSRRLGPESWTISAISAIRSTILSHSTVPRPSCRSCPRLSLLVMMVGSKARLR